VSGDSDDVYPISLRSVQFIRVVVCAVAALRVGDAGRGSRSPAGRRIGYTAPISPGWPRRAGRARASSVRVRAWGGRVGGSQRPNMLIGDGRWSSRLGDHEGADQEAWHGSRHLQGTRRWLKGLSEPHGRSAGALAANCCAGSSATRPSLQAGPAYRSAPTPTPRMARPWASGTNQPLGVTS